MRQRPKGELTRALGIVIRECRIAGKMSQETLAFDAGIDRSFLSEIECGLKCPTIETVAALAYAMDSKPSELLKLAEERISNRL